jgi:hypothetical protein
MEVPRDEYRALLDDALSVQADFSGFGDDNNPDAVLALAKGSP